MEVPNLGGMSCRAIQALPHTSMAPSPGFTCTRWTHWLSTQLTRKCCMQQRPKEGVFHFDLAEGPWESTALSKMAMVPRPLITSSPPCTRQGGCQLPDGPTTMLFGSMDSTASRNLNCTCWYSRWCSKVKYCTPRRVSRSCMPIPGRRVQRASAPLGKWRQPPPAGTDKPRSSNLLSAPKLDALRVEGPCACC